ncbi:pickpocket protein 11 [Drosophila hydei]|uniref:Pickpocket protein 11 n=1 Tax=Drosophila hydei TaxID=7224 RepID=A0A6J1LZS7_DROHY|nr:pickpocket protein 11 [Drosophila hydei]
MSRLNRALRKTLVEFFKKTSLNGFGLLYFIRRRPYQRIFWFLFIATGISAATFVVFSTLLQFLASPTVTSLSELSLESVESLPFPALAICSANKLSRQRLQEFAEQLALSNGESREHWLKQLQLLAGYFYPLAVSAVSAAELQVALASHWPRDVRSQLLQLSPSCERFLLSCHVDAVASNCSELFRLTPSFDGCCCVLQHSSSISGSLTLRLNASHADDFHMPRSQATAAFSLHLPGWQGRASLAPGESSSIHLRALHLKADPQLRNYPLTERGCHFPEEAEHLVQCLPLCRLRSTLAACNCAPFVYDLATADGQLNNVSYCTLAQTACLQSVEASWSPWSCVECLPACNDWRYELRKSLSGYVGQLESRVSIRYDGQRVPVYLQAGLYNWYQLLSNIGGVLSVCIGCSFISGFEFVYFMVFRLWHNWQQLGM